MGSGVIEIFPLDVDARPCEMRCQVLSKSEGRGSTGVGGHQIFIFFPEIRISLGVLKRRNQLLESRNEDLGDISASELTVIACFNHHTILPPIFHILKTLLA